MDLASFALCILLPRIAQKPQARSGLGFPFLQDRGGLESHVGSLVRLPIQKRPVRLWGRAWGGHRIGQGSEQDHVSSSFR